MTTAESLDAPSVDLQIFYLEKKSFCIVLIIEILVNNCSNKYEKKEHNIGDHALPLTGHILVRNRGPCSTFTFLHNRLVQGLRRQNYVRMQGYIGYV